MAEQEIEDLEALLASPGWQRLVAFALKEWSSDQYRVRVQKALSAHTNDKAADAAILIMRIEDTAKAVDNLLHWPAFRLSQLRTLRPR